MSTLGIERLLRDGKAGWMMGASNEVLRQLVGKTSLLGLGAVDLWYIMELSLFPAASFLFLLLLLLLLLLFMLLLFFLFIFMLVLLLLLLFFFFFSICVPDVFFSFFS